MKTATQPTLAHSALPAIDPDQWVEQYGDLLLGYAIRHVADRTTAEDLVQETFLAAWQARATFRGDAKFETWLVGILRRKACDHLRQKGREVACLDETAPQTAADALPPFDHRGRWQTRPGRWSTLPGASVENEEFWSIVRHCLGGLPEHFAEAFRRRIATEEPLKELSAALGISPDNLSVRLHRARLLLRNCLAQNWFGEAAQPRRSQEV